MQHEAFQKSGICNHCNTLGQMDSKYTSLC